jgi:hypothetical protein
MVKKKLITFIHANKPNHYFHLTLNSKLLNRWATDRTVKQISTVLRFKSLGVSQRLSVCRI